MMPILLTIDPNDKQQKDIYFSPTYENVRQGLNKGEQMYLFYADSVGGNLWKQIKTMEDYLVWKVKNI